MPLWPTSKNIFYNFDAVIIFNILRYDEINNWNYRKARTKGGAVGHFTQMVWVTTRKVGYGVAVRTLSNGNIRTIVVAKYSPPGNFNMVGKRFEYYSSNVQPEVKWNARSSVVRTIKFNLFNNHYSIFIYICKCGGCGGGWVVWCVTNNLYVYLLGEKCFIEEKGVIRLFFTISQLKWFWVQLCISMCTTKSDGAGSVKFRGLCVFNGFLSYTHYGCHINRWEYDKLFTVLLTTSWVLPKERG